MNTNTCIYCGSSDIVPVDEEHYLEQNLHILQCRQCKVMFTELEQKLEADETLLDYKPDFDVSDEETTLNAVWKQWDKSWSSHNLELLFQHKQPLKHPAEFMIYRDLWQVLDASYSYDILAPGKNYDHRYACEHLLAMLINNLQQLEYFLSSYTEEQRLRAMRRLYEALGRLREGTIHVGQAAGDKEAFADSVYQQRLTAVITLAEQLEDMYDAGHGLDCLKMAGRLWHKCLGTGHWLNECVKDPHNYSKKQSNDIPLPESRRKHITLKESEISKTIRQTEPNFQMFEPVSWKKKIPWFYIWLSIILSIVASAVVTAVRIFSDSGDIARFSEVTGISSISLAVLHFLLMFFAFFISSPFLVFLIWLSVTVIKSNRRAKKEKLKREQIYKRLYAGDNQ